jgi:hypothetical protein
MFSIRTKPPRVDFDVGKGLSFVIWVFGLARPAKFFVSFRTIHWSIAEPVLAAG